MSTKTKSLGDFLQEFSHHRRLMQEELFRLVTEYPGEVIPIRNGEELARIAAELPARDEDMLRARLYTVLEGTRIG